MDQTGVAVAGLGIAVPGDQARQRILTPVDTYLRLLPGRLFEQQGEPAVRRRRLQPVRLKIQLGAGQLHIASGE
ncbi:hypothetical protein D3C87_2178750 [compost metagenome]